MVRKIEIFYHVSVQIYRIGLQLCSQTRPIKTNGVEENGEPNNWPIRSFLTELRSDIRGRCLSTIRQQNEILVDPRIFKNAQV